LLVLPIYAASERPIEGVDSRALCDGIRAHGHKDVRFAEDMDDALAQLNALIAPGDVVLTLGAGNIYRLGERLVEQLKG
jgi:UDP-N-acetylmuramate--alanine ligase